MSLRPRNVAQTEDGLAFLLEATDAIDGMILSYLSFHHGFEILRSPDNQEHPCVAIHISPDGINPLENPEELFPDEVEWA